MSNQLTEIKKLGLFLGRVSEVHIKNLEAFPFIFFNGLTEANLDYSVSSQGGEDSVFSYDLSLDMALNDQTDKRFKALEKSVRELFWKESKIVVKINGEEVYKSE